MTKSMYKCPLYIYCVFTSHRNEQKVAHKVSQLLDAKFIRCSDAIEVYGTCKKQCSFGSVYSQC